MNPAPQHVKAIDLANIRATVHRQGPDVPRLFDELQAIRGHMLLAIIRIRENDLLHSQLLLQVRTRSNQLVPDDFLCFSGTVDVMDGV